MQRSLYVFLLTSYGQNYLKREARGSVQQHVFLSQIENFEIPILDKYFVNEIESLILNSENKREISKKTYNKAEKLLLQEIGLDGFNPTKETFNIKSFNETFGVTGRLDAEYYQPKYDEIEAILKSKNYCTVLNKELIKIDTGEYSPEYFNQKEKSGMVFYIRSTNIKCGQVELDENYYVDKSNFNRKAEIGDIITARVGSVGVFGEVREDVKGSVYSDNVISFRLTEAFIPSVYTLLFNCKYYYEFIDRMARGSVQQRLNQETFKDLLIPIIDFEKQQQISYLVEESFKLKKESEHLLEVAKTAVEVAIEQNEEKAIEYISKNTLEVN